MNRSHFIDRASAFAGEEASNDSSSEQFKVLDGFDHGERVQARQPPARRCTLLVTKLAPGVGAGVVSDIFKRCRERHDRLAITGTMLFDGERVGALFCGSPDQVSVALAAITSDPRQAKPLVLVDASYVPPWAGQHWRAGWCEPDALAALTEADAPQGPAAVETWRALMASSDVR